MAFLGAQSALFRVLSIHEQLLDFQVLLDGRRLAKSDCQPVHLARGLQTRTASLEQAGGLQRMTLRGHTGGVQKVLLTPGGIDLVTSKLPSALPWVF